jgi:hypothetical protein
LLISIIRYKTSSVGWTIPSSSELEEPVSLKEADASTAGEWHALGFGIGKSSMSNQGPESFASSGPGRTRSAVSTATSALGLGLSFFLHARGSYGTILIEGEEADGKDW